MPYPAELLSLPPAIVNVNVANVQGTVSVEPRPIAEAIAVANQPIKVLQNIAPKVENLPASARPGEQYMFAQQPDHIYVYGSDNVWRAIALIPVG